MLRNSENSTLRIFLDRNIRGVTKGKGKGRGKGKGKGKAAAPGKGGRGRGCRKTRAKAETVPRIVKLLRPPPAPPPPPTQPSERSYYGPRWRRVFKRLAEYHSQLVCLDLTVSLSSCSFTAKYFGESTSSPPEFSKSFFSKIGFRTQLHTT